MQQTRPDPVWANRFYKLAICMGLGLIAYYSFVTWRTAFLWDLWVYQDAVSRYLAGENPYSGAIFGFVYPPVFLAAFGWAGNLLSPLFMAFYAATLLLLGRTSMRPVLLGMSLFSLYFFFHSRAVVLAIVSGNLTFYLHVLVILAWMEGGWIREKLFPVLIVLCASLKPYFLAYALVPMMVHGMAPTVLVRTAALASATAASWALQYSTSPEEFRQFLAAVQRQTFKGDHAMLTGDIGFGFSRYLASLTGSFLAGLVLHTGLSVAIVAAVVRWRGWLADWGAKRGVDALSLLALIVAIVINPRLKIYDYCLSGSLATYLVAVFWLARPKLWFVPLWLVLDHVERKVGQPLFAKFLDVQLPTIILAILVFTTGMAEKRGPGAGGSRETLTSRDPEGDGLPTESGA